MKAIKTSITAFISDDQPGFVECRFYDAYNKEYIVEDKVPVVTEKDLDANSKYPQEGFIACEIPAQREDDGGKTIYSVTTTKPGAWKLLRV